MAAELTRDEFLSRPIRELTGYTLMPRCPGANCPITYYACTIIAKRGGGNITVAEWIRRLRCRHCRERVAHVDITDNTSHCPPYGQQPHTWIVRLYP